MPVSPFTRRRILRVGARFASAPDDPAIAARAPGRGAANLPAVSSPGTFETDVDHYGAPHPGCDRCSRNLPFELPESLVKSVADRKVVIFAGAGVSTEAREVLGFSLYDDLADELQIPKGTPFPDAVTAFEQRHGRAEFLRRTLERLEAAEAFRARWRESTRFHRELASIPQLRDIVTTNWDTLFERYAAALPMVTAQDFAFWDLPRRKVFKIHGSLANVGTLVASRQDYDRRARELRQGTLGASLKLLLATRVPVFVGYSFRDLDFEQIYRYLAREVGDALPHAYVVTHSSGQPPTWVRGNVIRTDAAYFVARIKQQLIEQGLMLNPRRLDRFRADRIRVVKRQNGILRRYSRSKWPSMIYATSYQDGLLDAIDYGWDQSSSGDVNDPRFLDEKVHAYRHLYAGAMRHSRYFDAAYIAGFNTGLLWLALPIAPVDAPMYFVFGLGQVRSLTQFDKLLKRAPKKTPKAHKAAARIVQQQPRGNVLHHYPTLHGVTPA